MYIHTPFIHLFHSSRLSNPHFFFFFFFFFFGAAAFNEFFKIISTFVFFFLFFSHRPIFQFFFVYLFHIPYSILFEEKKKNFTQTDKHNLISAIMFC